MDKKVLASCTGFISVVEKGEKGATERPRKWEDIPSGDSLQCGAPGEQWLDIILYGGSWYQCIKSHTMGDGVVPTNTIYYKNITDYKRFATDLFLAHKAYIENLQVGDVLIEKDGKKLLVANEDGITCNSGNFNNVNIIGTFRSEDNEYGNYITVDVKSGSVKLEGPSKIDMFTGKPTSDSRTIPLAYLQFMTDSGKGERFAQLRLDAASGGQDILISANNGIYIEDGAGTANINYRGVYYNRARDQKVFSKTWEEILS